MRGFRKIRVNLYRKTPLLAAKRSGWCRPIPRGMGHIRQQVLCLSMLRREIMYTIRNIHVYTEINVSIKKWELILFQYLRSESFTSCWFFVPFLSYLCGTCWIPMRLLNGVGPGQRHFGGKQFVRRHYNLGERQFVAGVTWYYSWNQEINVRRREGGYIWASFRDYYYEDWF